MKSFQRFTEIKKRAIKGEKVDCSIEWDYNTYIEFKNNQFILSRKRRDFNDVKKTEITKSQDWTIIVEKLDLIIKDADNTKIDNN